MALNERIICAANWYPNLSFKDKLKIPSKQYLPINCKTGIVFSGHRHLQCQRQMNLVTGKRAAEVEEIQGFLTNKNRFVDRKEAAQIAINEDQILDKSISNIESLYSEDLY